MPLAYKTTRAGARPSCEDPAVVFANMLGCGDGPAQRSHTILRSHTLEFPSVSPVEGDFNTRGIMHFISSV